MPVSSDESRRIVWVAIVFEGSLIAIALILAWWLDIWPLPGVDVSRQGWAVCGRATLLGLLAALPLIAGLILIECFPRGPFRELNEVVESDVIPLFAAARIWQMGLIALLAGIGEELLFRGLLQTAIGTWTGPPNGVWIGLIAASLAFGLCHWLNDAYLIAAALVGVYLGLLLIFSEQILVPIVAHGLYDFVALIYLVKRSPRAV